MISEKTIEEKFKELNEYEKMRKLNDIDNRLCQLIERLEVIEKKM